MTSVRLRDGGPADVAKSDRLHQQDRLQRRNVGRGAIGHPDDALASCDRRHLDGHRDWRRNTTRSGVAATGEIGSVIAGVLITADVTPYRLDAIARVRGVEAAGRLDGSERAAFPPCPWLDDDDLLDDRELIGVLYAVGAL